MVELKRITGCGKATPGALYVDGEFICFSIENTDKLFPAGTYKLRLTRTQRTMPTDFKGQAYEIVDVEGRTYIKIHVANFWYELEGCVGPNTGLHPTTGDIRGLSSADATRKFMIAMGGRDDVIIKVTEV
jgi:hypothetical protein